MNNKGGAEQCSAPLYHINTVKTYSASTLSFSL